MRSARGRAILTGTAFVVLLGAIATVALWRAHEIEQKHGSLEDASKAIAFLEHSYAQFAEGQAALSAMVLLQDPALADTYRQYAANVERELKAIRAGALERGATGRAADIDRLIQRVTSFDESIELGITSILEADREEALEIVAEARPNLVSESDAVRADLADLVTDARADVAAQRAEANRAVDISLIMLTVLGGVAILAGTALIVMMVRSVMRPLDSLRDSARAITSGDLEARATVSGPEEVASLARDFNAMVVERERAERALRLAHDDLELRVQQRTTDLLSANEHLQREVAERRRAEEALRASEANYRSIFENVQDIFYRTDEKGIITEISPSVERYGYTREGIIGTQVLDIYEDAEQRSELLAAVLERGEVMDYEVRLKAADGTVLDSSVSTHVLRHPDGSFAGVEGSLRDVSERKRAQEALRESEDRYRDLFENANDIIYTHDLNGRFTSINRAAEQVFGYTREEALRENIAKVVAPESLEMAREMIMRKLNGERLTTYELDAVTKDGRRVPVEVSTRIIYNDGKPVGVQGIARDVSERRRLEQQLVHLANHDPLTGLFNRRRFQEELESHLAQAKREGTDGAVLFLDLDQFKDVNDSLGHRAGDELLAVLAGLLREQLRQTDVVGRSGGDEFAILLPRTDAGQAQEVAAKLLEAVRRHTFLVRNQPVSVTASIGIAAFPEHGATAEELLAWSDLAMYQAKEKGPNAFAVYVPDRDWQAQIESRLGWQNRIRDALEKQQFLLYAQPILDLQSGQVSRYELLLRLRRDGTIIPADSFVHIAERFGLIQAIDRWVVGRAIHLIAESRHEGRDLQLEVNLSGKAFDDGELMPLIRRELETTSIDPTSLVLEVTETAAIANIGEAQRFVRTLKGLGCRFALDDFGVGFSSFYHLKHLPVDYLKIDGSFIRDLPHSPVDQHLVQAIVEVAHGLGKRTIAESVGSDDAVGLLRQYGVDYAQGYHIGHPHDVSEILADTPRDSEHAA